MTTDKLARAFFVASTVMLTFGAGVLAEHFNVWPLPWLKSSASAVEELMRTTGTRLPWYYLRAQTGVAVPVSLSARMAPGLTLIALRGPDETNSVRVVDAAGRVVHEWRPDWFAIWPDATHIPEPDRPKSIGGLVHGAMLMPNGDLVFNFSELALVRMDACGNVRWKLPYRTHHSVAVDNAGNLWVPGEYVRETVMEDVPNHEPPFYDHTLMRISAGGDVLEEIRVFDLLVKNGLSGLLYLSTVNNRTTTVSGDTMHLNDIEVFPDALRAGVFAPGDVMISLRNINAVLVFDPGDWRVKYASIGRVLRQHDPDFVDGNTISVFDNNNLTGEDDWNDGAFEPRGADSSRVVTLSATSNRVTVLYAGTPRHPLFTDIMGSHELLANGNVLITESVRGRVIEVARDGRTVWEYVNIVGNGVRGLVSGAERLDERFNEQFFQTNAATCSKPQ